MESANSVHSAICSIRWHIGWQYAGNYHFRTWFPPAGSPPDCQQFIRRKLVESSKKCTDSPRHIVPTRHIGSNPRFIAGGFWPAHMGVGIGARMAKAARISIHQIARLAPLSLLFCAGIWFGDCVSICSRWLWCGVSVGKGRSNFHTTRQFRGDETSEIGHG